MIIPVCCNRDEATPPSMKIIAARTALVGCQPRLWKRAEDPEAAEQEMREDNGVEGLHGGMRRDERKQHHARGEDQGLRIGDRRMAGKVIGVPERDSPCCKASARKRNIG